MTDTEKILQAIRELDEKNEKRFSLLETQVQENTQFINALTKRVELMDAKLDGIQLTTASIKQVQDLRISIGERLKLMGQELSGN